jgi:hypothetical protein
MIASRVALIRTRCSGRVLLLLELEHRAVGRSISLMLALKSDNGPGLIARA